MPGEDPAKISHHCGFLTLRDDGAGSNLTADDCVYTDNNQEAVVVEAAHPQKGGRGGGAVLQHQNDFV